MSTTSFETDRELNFVGNGSLTEVRSLLEKVNPAACLSSAVALYREIAAVYRDSLENDGKIIGKERTDLLEQVDFLLDVLILLWRTLADENEERIIISIQNRKSGFGITINEKNNLWTASGQLNRFMTRTVKNFAEVFNNRLGPQIAALLGRYAEMTQAGSPGKGDVQIIRQDLKRVMYHVLFIRFQLESCLINT